MSQYQHTNPTHGAKNTSDPAARNDPKKEFSGTVLKDSLAAESIESGGSFSRGNPTGIHGATAASSTLNRGDDTEGFRRVHDSEDPSSGYTGKDDDNEAGSQTQRSGKSAGMQMQSNSDWVQPDGNYNSSRTQKSERSRGEDMEFGGVNYVDRQPEIGSKEDPGRLAEKKFADMNARRDLNGGFTGEMGGDNRENPFDPLGGDRNL